MPQVIAAIIVAVTFGAVSGGAALAIATAVVEIGISVILSAIAKALVGVPKPPSVQTPIKQSRPLRQSAFGRVRVSGPYMLFEAANQTLVDVIALLDGESDGFEGFYLNDDRVSLTGGGGVISPDGKKYTYGTPGDRVQIRTRLGHATETAYSEVVAAVPSVWNASCRGDGVTSMAMLALQSKPQFQQEDFPNGQPLPGAVVRAQKCFDPRTGTTVWTENPVLQLIAYLTTASGGMGLDYDRRIAPAAQFWKDAADDCDLTVDVANQHASITTDPWADAGRDWLDLSNVAGIVPGTVLTFADETKTVDNVSGLRVNLTSTLTYRHLKGEKVTWVSVGGTTEKRYRSGGVYSHETSPSEVIAELLSTFDGFLTSRGDGALLIYSGRYYDPTVILGDDAIVGYTLQHFRPDEQSVNCFQVAFTDPDANFQEGDAGTWNDTADILARGVTRISDLKLPWVPSSPQARRLAKRKMARENPPLRGTIVTNLGGMKALGERYLRIRCAENSAIADIVVEIVDRPRIDLAAMQLTFPWVQADPDIDEWTTAQEASGGEVNDRLTPAPLEQPVITADVFFDGNLARLLINTGSDRSDLHWQVRWRVTGTTDWTEASFTDVDDGTSIDLKTGAVAQADTLDVEARYLTAGGVSSWSDTVTVNTLDEATAPEDATMITLASWGSSISLYCAPIARARTYRWKVYGVDSPPNLLRTADTASPQFSYTREVAAGDGVARDYIITVEGVNAAGAGSDVSTGHISKAAPAAVTLGSIVGGSTATVPFTTGGEPDIGGVVLYYADSPGFDPLTAGTPVTIGASPFVLYGLSVATHYLRVAAYDSWTSNPTLLNFAGEASVVITSLSSPSPGGDAGGGGGYHKAPPIYHGGGNTEVIP